MTVESTAPLSLVFHALADPTRRLLLERLTRGPASVSELARPLAMSLPAVVQHLQLLEASGLVRTEKVGRVRTCHIETAPLRSAERWIGERRTTWERRFDRLGELLASEPPPEPPRAPHDAPSASTPPRESTSRPSSTLTHESTSQPPTEEQPPFS
jgi:DNA-binding transcriptional ArsR family regulator